ncbi:isopenicillin N synthase family dioxygenase [Jannaschia ovalis]|uniref:2-oxoglutarate-dependent ethylene/succinate-forming enzyme n=1 Tax=Jannaschia ovalis TaxID=3038773 RepID=A0ABY8LHH6_9RHOB|nr:2-oxoglutarate and iron-dependent oxygenase domain-containing protein [Jannaschia sp. GRR-S6-38]WGH79595.1 2-oxoglutarate and iron-dependent oxygenase domain-containing protein [Jannaschia sp. GRR-S6-38]
MRVNRLPGQGQPGDGATLGAACRDLTPPLISVAGLLTGDRDAARAVADQIGRAARDVGFFRICDHGIEPARVERTYAVARRFFALPDTVKRRYYIGHQPNHRGYVPFSEKGDYPDEKDRSYEAFDLGLDLPADDPDFLAGIRLLGPNVWPELAGFRDAVAAYYDAVSQLGRRICAALEIHLGLPEGAMTSRMRKPISQLRLLHYVRDAGTTDHQSVNMGAHTDYECLTLLHTRNAGLQVMTRDDEWIDVPVDPAVLVVNIGDMLEAWTNGMLRSTPHRVLNLSPERFSLPYFVAADYGTVIEPFPELIAPGEGPRYAPFSAGAHLERMLVRDFPYLRAAKAGGAGADPDAPPEESFRNPFETRLNGTGTEL